jgi:hypothetical protein
MNIERRQAILDQAGLRLSINPPADHRRFITEVRQRLVAEAEMSWQASYYAVMELAQLARVRC